MLNFNYGLSNGTQCTENLYMYLLNLPQSLPQRHSGSSGSIHTAHIENIDQNSI